MSTLWPKLQDLNLNTVLVLIRLAPEKFVVAGTGVVVTFTDKATKQAAGILSIEEGRYDKGRWVLGRRLNGDQSHRGRHLRIPVGSWDIQQLTLY